MKVDYHRHDLTDRQWVLLEAHLPRRAGMWGGVAHDNRRFINGVIWLLRTGTPVRELHPEYGRWSTPAATTATNHLRPPTKTRGVIGQNLCYTRRVLRECGPLALVKAHLLMAAEPRKYQQLRAAPWSRPRVVRVVFSSCFINKNA